MKTSTLKTSATKFTPRIRFNWGFHDGTAEAERGSVRNVSSHFDKAYAAGYDAGVAAFRETGTRPESSDAAWANRCTCKVPFGFHAEKCRAA